MSIFVALAIFMTVVALAWVLLPLLRRRPDAGVDGGVGVAEGLAVRDSNLSILRDQLAELERDLDSGTISAHQHALARAELERRALEEADAQAPTAASREGRRTAVTLGLLIPLGALFMYLWIGAPAGLRAPDASGEQPVAAKQVDEMVEQLAARLEKNPDDSRGWMMLGRSYYVLQRMPEAVAAYARAAEGIANDAGLYADYADAVAMSQGRRIEGKALELLDKALKIDPEHPKALAMAGSAAFYRKDYPVALGYWEKLRTLLPPESEMAKSVAGGIAEARELGGIKAPASVVLSKPEAGAVLKSAASPAPKAAPKVAADAATSANAKGISGRVTLSPALAGKASPEDTLFVLARAVNGPRMPLAVLKKRVSDLPIEFTLDDSLAMSPEFKLSAFPEVVVSARISKSGNAMSQSGDLQGVSGTLKTDAKAGVRGVVVLIDVVVP